MATLVRHVMAQEPKTATPEMNAYDAAGLMASYDIGAVPIVQADKLVGLVTDRDLVLRVLAARQDPQQVKLGDIATTRDLVTVTPDTQLSEARQSMADHKIRRLPVVKEDVLVGVISIGDIAESSSSMRSVGDVLREVSEPRAAADRV